MVRVCRDSAVFRYTRMAHSFKASMLKRVCNMDWAHRLSNTACFDRDIWEFFAVLCTVHVDQRLCRPPRSSGVHGFRSGSRFCGRRFRRSTQHSTSWHSSYLEVLKRKKGKENHKTDKRKLKKHGGKRQEENLYLFKVDLKRLQVYFILLLL